MEAFQAVNDPDNSDAPEHHDRVQEPPPRSQQPPEVLEGPLPDAVRQNDGWRHAEQERCRRAHSEKRKSGSRHPHHAMFLPQARLPPGTTAAHRRGRDLSSGVNLVGTVQISPEIVVMFSNIYLAPLFSPTTGRKEKQRLGHVCTRGRTT